MPESQEQESQARIDSIIALIMEEAKTVTNIEREASRIYYVWVKLHKRVMEIMRTRE